jgi:hypothetical protein
MQESIRHTSRRVNEMKVPKLWALIASSLFISILAACAGVIDTGTLFLSLSDATTAEYNAVYVTIQEVQVHTDEGGNWQRVASPNKTYNLLELVNGVREQLGITELETAHYTQMRLIIGKSPDDTINLLSERHPYANYIIDNADTYYELKIPSGYQTGIKIVHGFDITENETTELILDFDASRSIVKAGNSGQWLLKPTVKVLDTADYSIISGTVIAPDAEGVLVSAQVYDPGADDEKDSVVIQASTIADENGFYTIFLHPGTYNIVAYKDGYNPGCAKISLASNSSYIQDFTLNAASSGEITGTVSIDGGDEEQYATLSFRQSAQCEGSIEEEIIEVQSLNSADNTQYSLRLPVGIYSAVASSYGKETKTDDNIEITTDTATPLNISF